MYRAASYRPRAVLDIHADRTPANLHPLPTRFDAPTSTTSTTAIVTHLRLKSARLPLMRAVIKRSTSRIPAPALAGHGQSSPFVAAAGRTHGTTLRAVRFGEGLPAKTVGDAAQRGCVDNERNVAFLPLGGGQISARQTQY